MFASGALSLLHTGGSSSFPLDPNSDASYRSPTRHHRHVATSKTHHHHHHPTIQLSQLTKILDASLVLRGMASSSDEECKHETPPAACSHPLQLPPLKQAAGSRTGSPSPGTATTGGIAAMSLSFIINNDNTENTPANSNTIASPAKENAYHHGAIQDANVGASKPPATTSSGFAVNSILNTVCAKPDCYRTIRGPPGSFCKYHKQSRFCRAENCNKSAKTGGYCISHGGGKRCSFQDCTKSAKQGGLCISHGGGKRCSEEGCTKSALVGGYCSAHGGGRKCKTSACAKTALLGGYCIAHGGGKRCQVDGCAKSAVGGALCVSHGGGKRCQTDGCDKGAVRNGVCIRHGAKRDGATSSNASGSPSPVKSVKHESDSEQSS